MSHETGEVPDIPQEAEEPKKEFDVGRANREFERWMMQGNSGFLLDAPRDDQRGVYSDELPAYSSPPSNWRDGAKLVMTKVFNFEKGTIVYERAGDAESPAEVEP